jgi:hypothetical protein
MREKSGKTPFFQGFPRNFTTQSPKLHASEPLVMRARPSAGKFKE